MRSLSALTAVVAAWVLVLPVTALSQQRPYWRNTTQPVPLQCTPSVPGLNWQWRTNARTGGLKRESPLMAIQFGLPASPSDGLKALQHGQRHSNEAKRIYAACQRATNVAYLFYLAATASDVACSQSAVREAVAWIYSHEPATVINTITDFDRAQAQPGVDAQDSGVLRAFAVLLYRQRHNPDALAVMRACFRDDPVQYFSTVRGVIQ